MEHAPDPLVRYGYAPSALRDRIDTNVHKLLSIVAIKVLRRLWDKIIFNADKNMTLKDFGNVVKIRN